MKYILTPEEMRKADAEAIEKYRIPSEILMENAARSSAIYIEQIFEERNLIAPKIAVFCGSGNNGGDGFALVRHLFNKFEVKIFWIGDESKMSPETRMNFESVKAIGVPIEKIETLEQLEKINLNYDVLIDAMIGVGGSENIRGIALDILKKLKEVQSLKIAIDSPTGLNTLNGFANPYCFEADYTITMYTYKLGLLINEGQNYSGQILVAELGSPKFIVEQISKIFAYCEMDIQRIIPKRKRISSKFDYGRVLIIAGSERYPGAAALAANASIKSGAGLTVLASTTFHPAVLPEVIRFPLPSTTDGSISIRSIEILRDEIERADSVAIGPGLSDNLETIQLVEQIVEEYKNKKRIVIDADALKAIEPSKKMTKKVVITPHCGELSRIIEMPRREIEQNSFFVAKEWAEKLNCIIHLKFVPSVTTDGEFSYLTLNGNPGMATGGSGDVLTGIIATMLARGIEPLQAASISAFIHSLAGDKYSSRYGMETLTASSLIDILPEIL
mgnify:CR=1 FL=1